MNARRCTSAAVLCVASALFAMRSAKADSFQFTLSGTNTMTGYSVLGTGQIVTAPDATRTGLQDVTGITGTLNGFQIQGTVGSNFTPTTVKFPDTFQYTFDNLLNPGDPSDPFDENGLGFETTNGVQYNIGTDPTQGLLYQAFDGQIQFDQQTYLPIPVTLTLTPTSVTPEPSSIALLGTGLLASAGLLRRRLVRG